MAISNITSKNVGITNLSGDQNSVTDAEAKKDKRDPHMREAARGFENQFIRQMISEMRKTVPKDSVVEESMADDIFRDQLDDQYADQWVNQGGIGLADMIYDQLYEKYGPAPGAIPQALNKTTQMRSPQGLSGSADQKHILPGSQGVPPKARAAVGTPSGGIAKSDEKPQDILSRADKNLFVMKLDPGVMTLKSKEPLPEKVSLRSPLSGTVLQAAALQDGRQMVVLRHDQGLVTRFVHTGSNRVKTDMKVAAGEVIAELPASQKGESANVVFELRQTPQTE